MLNRDRTRLRRNINLIGLPLLAIVASQPAWAAETLAGDAGDRSYSSREIVVTASGYEQKITEAPASISVVTEEDLRQRPYLTLIDAVRDIEGVDVGVIGRAAHETDRPSA